MHTLPREQSGLGDEVPLLGDFLHDDDKPAKLAKAKDFIKRKFPKANFGKIRPLLFGKSERNEGEIVYLGERNEKEYPVFFKNGSNLLKSFTNTFKEALGPEAKDVISEDNTAIREEGQRLREAEKQLKESEGISVVRQKKANEAQNLRGKIEKTQARIDALTEKHGSNLEAQVEVDRLKTLRKNHENELKRLPAN